MQHGFKYQGFISYSHADEDVAAQLHKALETFSVPKYLRNSFGKNISPIFRDKSELTAHHSLSDKIREAVQSSRFLIVLCSPAAKDSHWVNEEIRLFRKLHGESSILCAITEGTPASSFPPALLEEGREPIAANLESDHFKHGLTQLAASILGVELDDLLQREFRRRRKRTWLITGASLTFSAITGVMAWSAIDARDEAETSRSEAEKMVEFMLTDLQSDLKPIGKLDILDRVGDRVIEYYDAIPLSDMDTERVVRQARALHVLGNVGIVQGNFEIAEKHIAKSFNLTKHATQKNADNPQYMQAHGQSNYWYTSLYLEQAKPGLAVPFADDFITIARELYESDTENPSYVYNYALAHNNRGYTYYSLGEYDASIVSYRKATQVIDDAKKRKVDSPKFKPQRAEQVNNVAVSYIQLGKVDTGLQNLEIAIEAMEAVYEEDTTDKTHLDKLMIMKLWREHTNITQVKNCVPANIYDLTSELELMLQHDETNKYWVSDYIEFVYRVLQGCSTEIAADWRKGRVQNLRDIARNNTVLKDYDIKKIKWITEQSR